FTMALEFSGVCKHNDKSGRTESDYCAVTLGFVVTVHQVKEINMRRSALLDVSTGKQWHADVENKGLLSFMQNRKKEANIKINSSRIPRERNEDSHKQRRFSLRHESRTMDAGMR
ncbi:hypothetical protein KUCAC02_035703, partial [Chaenocephalus aceratus]